jgi:hypothetical protein
MALGVAIVSAMLIPQIGMTRINSNSACSACSVESGVLYLYTKNPHTWEILQDKGEARLEFSREEGTFHLDARMLQPDTAYALIQHEPDYPTGSGYIIAAATSDSRGNLHLRGDWKRWKGKFWLVPQSNVSGKVGDKEPDRLKHWDPERYLFEGRVL